MWLGKVASRLEKQFVFQDVKVDGRAQLEDVAVIRYLNMTGLVQQVRVVVSFVGFDETKKLHVK